jgi:hypothetical protein
MPQWGAFLWKGFFGRISWKALPTDKQATTLQGVYYHFTASPRFEGVKKIFLDWKLYPGD